MEVEADKSNLIVINALCRDKSKTRRLSQVLDYALEGHPYELMTLARDFRPLLKKKILFAVSLGESGINLELYGFLKKMRLDRSCFEGSVGSIIIDGNSELFTKSVAREVLFSANLSGCAFPGKPLVEGTASLNNFNIIAANMAADNITAYMRSAQGLVKNLINFRPVQKRRPQILVIHAGNRQYSNTIALWDMVKEHLSACNIQEIGIQNGEMVDCVGCPYTVCRHYGENSNCFYGGVMVEDIYPAITHCDALVLLCPNYNDAVGANISAFINRLTALFHKVKFYDKTLFAVVVSGYSGSDIVAQQLLSSLNMNKTFRLPPRFALLETAHSPGSIRLVPGISEKAEAFAQNILTDLLDQE